MPDHALLPSPTRPTRPTTSAIADAVDSLRTCGYAVLPGLLGERERSRACALLDQIIERERMPEHGVFGYAIHPLIARCADLVPYFMHPTITQVAEAFLDDRIRLVHTGARIADPVHARAGSRIGWHNHAFTPDLRTIPPGDDRRGTMPRRLLYGHYLDGSTAAMGTLVGIPRTTQDPLAPPCPSRDAGNPWPGEIPIAAPPGSAILFTIDLWHTATSGTGTQRRRLMGAHIQARGCTDAHPEDHDHGPAALQEALRRYPDLHHLL